MAEFIRSLPDLALKAMVKAGHDYAGNKIGSPGGGTVAQASEGIVGRRFEESGNKRFATLSARYAAWKAFRFGQKPILVRSGKLKKKIIGHGKVRLVGTMVEIVFSVPEYGVYHQKGEGRLPKRSPVDPNASDIKAVQESAARHYDSLVKIAAARRGIVVR